MKKVICLLVLVAVVGGIALTATGCGSSGGGGIFAALGVLVIAAVATSGGAAAPAAFAASTRQATKFNTVTTSRYEAVVKINNNIATRTTNLMIRDTNGDNKFIELVIPDVKQEVNPGKVEYSVDIYFASATVPIMKLYGYTDVNSGDTKTESAQIDRLSTAKALAYEKWKERYSTYTFEQFTPDETKLIALASQVQDVFNTNLGTPTANFNWPSTIIASATEIASETGLPSNIVKGFVEIPIGYQWVPGQANLEYLAEMASPPSVIGLAYFNLQIGQSTLHTLGNFYYNNGDDTKVIRYLPGVQNLEQVTVATDTYNHQALATGQPQELQQFQCFGFYINGYYGAIMIHSITEGVIGINYKYNREKGNKNLTDQAFAAKIAY